MRYSLAALLCLLAVSLAAPGQGDEEELFARRAEKFLPTAPWHQIDKTVPALMKHKAGIAAVENVIKNLLNKDRYRHSRCTVFYLLNHPSAVPDDMLPHAVAMIEFNKTIQWDLAPLAIGKVGPRAKAALPTLQWMAENNPDEKTAAAAFRAIRSVEKR